MIDVEQGGLGDSVGAVGDAVRAVKSVNAVNAVDAVDAVKSVNAVDAVKSVNAVDAAVDRFMRDHNINSPFLPDCVERRLYRNFIHLALTVARGALDGVRVRVFGHVLRLTLRPEAEDDVL